MDEKLKKIYVNYIKWKARPLEKENPIQNSEDFCKKYKITLKVLTEFTQLDSYEEGLYLETISWAKSKTPEILHMLYSQIRLSKSPADVERFMNLVYQLKNKGQGSGQVTNNFINLTDEQYAAIVSRENRLLTGGREKEVIELHPTYR